MPTGDPPGPLNLITKADPTHLPLFLTNDVLLYDGNDVFNCCIIGFHGANPPAVPHSNGNAGRSRPSPGRRTSPPESTLARTAAFTGRSRTSTPSAPTCARSRRAIHFVNDLVEPWLTPARAAVADSRDPRDRRSGGQQSGRRWEEDRPTTARVPTRMKSQSTDGPCPVPRTRCSCRRSFAARRTRTPNRPIRRRPNVGRYPYMGDLNPSPGFRQPATG